MENVDFKDIVKPSVIPSKGSRTLPAGRQVEGSSPTAKNQELKANRQPPITNTHINIGTGKEISIKELAETLKK